jgi:hypothetical protein
VTKDGTLRRRHVYRCRRSAVTSREGIVRR